MDQTKHFGNGDYHFTETDLDQSGNYHVKGHTSDDPELPIRMLTAQNKTSILHTSMEDIHYPKSYRGTSRSLTSTSTSTSSASDRPEILTSTSSKVNVNVRVKKECPKPMASAGAEPEIGSLYKYIQEQKREVLVRKATAAFLYGGLKRSSEKFSQAEEQTKLKEVESAARVILNTLLLNSWRQDKLQLTRIIHENAQLTISVENLGLQLRVLRHLQSQEKDRANEKVTEIRNLKNQVNSAQKSLKNAESDLASIQDELRFCREDNEKLSDQKTFLHKEVEELIHEKTQLVDAVEAERRRASRTEEEWRVTKAEYTDLRKQIKDLSAQSFQWKERSKTLEAQGIQIEQNLDLREKSLLALESNFNLLLSEREQLKLKQQCLKQECEDAEALIATEKANCESLQKRLQEATEAVATQQENLIALEESVLVLRDDNQNMLKELNWHELENSRRRKAWFNTINILRSPIKLVKYLLFGREDSTELLQDDNVKMFL